MKSVFIEKHQAEFSIQAMTRVFQVSRCGWYAWRKRHGILSLCQQRRV